MSEENNNNPDNAPAPEKSQGLSEEQVIKIVNAAVSTHVGRRTKGFEDKLTTMMDKFDQMSQAPAAAPAKGESADVESNDQVKALNAKLKALDAQLQQREQQLQQEAAQRKEQGARGALKDALAVAGVPSDRLKQAVGYLYDAEKRIAYSEEGNLEFLVPESGYTDRVDIQSGVQRFLSTDEGKIYLPPREVAGSGNTGGRAPKAKASSGNDMDNMSDDELLRSLGEALINN